MTTEHTRREWHLDKAFSVQSLLQAAMVLGAVYAYLSTLESRVTVIERAAMAQIRKDSEQDQETRNLRQEIRDDLKEIRALLENRPRR